MGGTVLKQTLTFHEFIHVHVCVLDTLVIVKSSVCNSFDYKARFQLHIMQSNAKYEKSYILI